MFKTRYIEMKKLRLLFGFAVFAAAAFLLAPTARADGVAVIAVEAFTVDYGFVASPVEVSFTTGQTAAELIDSVLGAANINDGSGTGSSVKSVKMDTDFVYINSEIDWAMYEKEIEYSDEISTDGWLAEGDLYTESGWLFILNNSLSTQDLSTYQPSDGDVIRISFSVYGKGADLAVQPASWSTASAVFEAVNRDALYKGIAEYYTGSDFDMDGYVEYAAIDLNSTQLDLDDARAFLNGETDTIDNGDFVDDGDDDSIEEETTTQAPTETTAPATTTTAATTAPDVTAPPATTAEPVPPEPSAPTGVNLFSSGLGVLALAGMLVLTVRKKRERNTERKSRDKNSI